MFEPNRQLLSTNMERCLAFHWICKTVPALHHIPICVQITKYSPHPWSAGYISQHAIITCHDDVIKWKHFPRYWPFVREIHRSPVNSPHKSLWRGALMFSLICVWINDWANNRETGDLRRYRAHCDVTVMAPITICTCYIFQSYSPWKLSCLSLNKYILISWFLSCGRS